MSKKNARFLRGIWSWALPLALFGLTSLAVVFWPGNMSFATSPQAAEWLAVHNRYRAEVGVPALQWSNNLAAGAQAWSERLVQIGELEHSDRNDRAGLGENLWMGSAGAYSPTQMVDSWGAEQANFRPGKFPNVSTTGNWADVGHYTQVVWRNTTQVGCGLASGGGWDILTCRYSPPGNFSGQAPF